MSRKLIVLFILVLFAVAVMSVSTNARSTSDNNSKVGTQYNFHRQAYDGQASSGGKTSGPVSLGAYSTSGNYPGYIVGYSWRDDQAHFTAHHMVDWGGTPRVHFTFMRQICSGDPNPCSRYYLYNYWNPTVSPGGVMAYGSNGLAIQDEPQVKGGLYPQLAIDQNGAAVITGETFDATLPGLGSFRRTETYWDVSPYGSFAGEDTLPFEPIDTTIDQHYPQIEFQEYGGEYITHIIELGDTGLPALPGSQFGSRQVIYWRKASASPQTGGTWTSTLLMEDIWSNSYAMAAAHDGSGKFGLCYFKPWEEGDVMGSYEIWALLSDDAGLTFDTLNILPKQSSSTDVWLPFADVDAMMDSENGFHVIWIAGQNNGINPARIYHWTNRVSGPVAGGKTSLVTVYDYAPDGGPEPCGVGQYNDLVIGKPVITECNSRLYTIWKQFGNVYTLDTANCSADSAGLSFQGMGNGSLYMSVSLSIDGSLWDAERLLTPGTTEGCTMDAGNECSNANYPSVARQGMNTADFGATYWSNAPQAFQVRDNIAPGYPENGYYVDVQYIDDLFPEIARYQDDYWTNNPIKWFRLPCIEAVVAPKILVDQDNFLFPTYWIKSGVEKTVDVNVLNIGNDVLHINPVEIDVIDGPGTTWMTVSPASLNIDPADSSIVSFTINPAGVVEPAPGTAIAIEADVIFHNDTPTPDSTLTWRVKTIVADTVVPILWDTIATGLDMKLMMANNGSAGYLGNDGDGGANLDFFASTQGDCDSGQGPVYLYDLTPVIMLSADSGDYWWQPFWRPSNVHDYNFVVVPSDDEAKSASGTAFSQYRTDKIVTGDSSIAMVKTWVAPNTSSSYMLERIQVFSNDGGTYNNVRIGEWIDWDIPSDTAATNFGGIVQKTGHVDYVYQQGYNFGDEDACMDNSTRFGASGFLGSYYTSEYNADPDVNHTGLYSGWVQLDADIFAGATDETFIADSAWKFLNTPGMDPTNANNSDVEDQQSWLSFGGFTISPTDTLTIWAVHASVKLGDETDLQTIIDDAETFYLANRADVGSFGCCGLFNAGHTGNTNCSGIPAGETRAWPDLSDITKLIDRVYISQAPLCCEENGDVNASGGDPDLADITKLIDHVYISQQDTPLCP